MAKRKWDTEKARVLYEQQMSDGEIAKELGVSVSAVGFWRRGLGFPANQECRPAAEASPETAVQVPECKKPTEYPPLTGPLALSVELNGCAFSLRAPDAESAAKIYEYAGRLLGEIQAAVTGKGAARDA